MKSGSLLLCDLAVVDLSLIIRSLLIITTFKISKVLVELTEEEMFIDQELIDIVDDYPTWYNIINDLSLPLVPWRDNVVLSEHVEAEVLRIQCLVVSSDAEVKRRVTKCGGVCSQHLPKTDASRREEPNTQRVRLSKENKVAEHDVLFDDVSSI
ncbi:hypothetical protein ACFE04_015605 [Oxalis oulophora]